MRLELRRMRSPSPLTSVVIFSFDLKLRFILFGNREANGFLSSKGGLYYPLVGKGLRD